MLKYRSISIKIETEIDIYFLSTLSSHPLPNRTQQQHQQQQHNHSDTIPEESTYQHGHSKSLCEPADGDDWDAMPLTNTGASVSASTASERVMHSGREPLLPRLASTPRAQIRHMSAGAVSGATVGVPGCKNQVTTALLDYEDTDSDTEDEDDDEGEDFDLYDDENIVVTTFTAPLTPRLHELGRRGGSGGGGASGSGPTTSTTTTSIRLTRNNDESIIWVSSSADAAAPASWTARVRSRFSPFQYEMFYWDQQR